jgi:hypothetical protein
MPKTTEATAIVTVRAARLSPPSDPSSELQRLISVVHRP